MKNADLKTMPKNLTTEQFADALHGKPSTIRTRLCKTGSFYGIRPIKLPSGRLMWKMEDVQAFLSGNFEETLEKSNA